MYEYEHPHPAVTTDCVIFSVNDERVQVLLIQRADPPYRGCWALPGGFVGPEETLEQGARRELEEETGLAGMELEQLHTFGDPDRDPRERVITVVYCGIVRRDQVVLRADSDAAAADWFDVDDLPALAFDHEAIMLMARERLSEKLDA